MKNEEECKAKKQLLSGINVINEEGRLVSITDAMEDESFFRISKGWSVLECRDRICAGR